MGEDLRFVVAAALGVAGAIAGWVMTDYAIAQAGNDSPELAFPYFIVRVGAALIFGLAGAVLVGVKR